MSARPTATDPVLRSPGTTDSYQLCGVIHNPEALPARVASHRLLEVGTCVAKNKQKARNASASFQYLVDWQRSLGSDALWKKALWTTLSTLRNTSISVACAWFLAFLCSLGTLSTAPVEKQSYTRFLTAMVLWGHTFFCATVFTTQVFFLVSHRLAATRSASSTALNSTLNTWVSIQALFRRTYAAYLMSLLLLLFTSYSVGSLLPVDARKYKVEFYLDCVASHIYTVKSMIATRQVIREQNTRLRQQQLRTQPSGDLPVELQPRQRGFVKRMAHFWKLVLQNWSLMLTVILAGLFVQGVSQYQIASQLETLLLTGGSVLFKLPVQESIKVCVFRRNIRDLRTMCVAIGLPTVLIDTQLRIALQRVQSFGATLNGTTLMAGAEICMRMLKVLLLRLEIRREARKLNLGTLSNTTSTQRGRSQRSQRLLEQSEVREQQVHGMRFQSSQMRPRRASTKTLKFQRWKSKLRLFHTAEIYADISAEYIAIGCSTAILYFFWTHPKFQLNQFDSVAADESPSSSSQDAAAGEVARWSRYTSVRIAIGTEIVVDYVSSMFELGAGIDFDQLRKIGRFVTCFFLCATAINIQISVIFYMRVE